ncbi:MAG: M56 family metallopeptidase, partial [Syntrophomonadaceae bacterium]|nr:M56 family metallopeptidase [Syntrophomonadaceae bacterium]
MSSYFITVLNMSLTASYVVMAVIIVRLLLKRAPKIFSYALWAIVLFRLVCPLSFESNFSLIPNNNEIIPHDIIYSQNPAINTGVAITDKAINQSIQSTLPPVNPAVSVNPMGIVLEIGATIWILGIVALLAYALIAYFRLKRRLSTATLVNDNIYETDGIKTPFVLGLIRPRIYIPTNLSGSEPDYIIKHEETHIRRYDYIIKPVAFLTLVIHWFNPFIWISYFLMVKDMEMSCDESVMKQFSGDIRASYSNSLLSLSIKQSGLLSPLAFGESNVKSRIMNVLNYRKPAFGTVVVIAVVAIAISVGLMVDPTNTIAYKNEALGFSLKLPQDWEGKYIIKETDNDITIFNKKIYEKYDGMGRIARVERQIGEMITAEDMLQAPVGQQIVLQGNGFTYFTQMPSDVQYPLDDTALSNEYNDMSEQMADIWRSIALNGKRQPVAANEGFRVKGTSFFTIEIPQGWEMKAMEGF